MDDPCAICQPKGHRCAPQEKDADGVLVGVAADMVAVRLEVGSAENVGSSVNRGSVKVAVAEGVGKSVIRGALAVASEDAEKLAELVPAALLETDAERVADPERLYDPDADADREQGRDAPISHTAEL